MNRRKGYYIYVGICRFCLPSKTDDISHAAMLHQPRRTRCTYATMHVQCTQGLTITLALAAAMLCSRVRPSYESCGSLSSSVLLCCGLQVKVCSCCVRSSPSAKSAAVKICSSGIEQVPASRPMAAPLSNAVSMNSVMPESAWHMVMLWHRVQTWLLKRCQTHEQIV